MRTRITAALIALVTAPAAAAPAFAQDGSGDGRTEAQQRVYRDYDDDGFLTVCRHEQATLEQVLEAIDDATDADTPDFRPKVQAAIAEHEAGSCDDEDRRPARDGSEDARGQRDDGGSDGTGGDDGRNDGQADDDGAADSGNADAGAPEQEAEADPGAAAGGGGSPTPPTAADVEPLPPEATPLPVPAATPVPATPAAPVTAYRNADDDVPVPLLALAGLLGALALLALLYALLSRIGWVDERLAGQRRAWREAGFRAGATWGDFTDWLRLGR